jgi:hypothetical protein
MTSISGAALSNSSRSPEVMKMSFPSFAGPTDPDTGPSMTCPPAARTICARSQIWFAAKHWALHHMAAGSGPEQGAGRSRSCTHGPHTSSQSKTPEVIARH